MSADYQRREGQLLYFPCLAVASTETLPVTLDDSTWLVLHGPIYGFSLLADARCPVWRSVDSLGRKDWSKRAGR